MTLGFSFFLQVDGIDIVIGGHTNTFLWKGDVPSFIPRKHKPVAEYPTVSADSSLILKLVGYQNLM